MVGTRMLGMASHEQRAECAMGNQRHFDSRLYQQKVLPTPHTISRKFYSQGLELSQGSWHLSFISFFFQIQSKEGRTLWENNKYEYSHQPITIYYLVPTENPASAITTLRIPSHTLTFSAHHPPLQRKSRTTPTGRPPFCNGCQYTASASSSPW